MKIIDALIKKIIERDNPTALGLDTAPEYLPENMAAATNCKSLACAVLDFNRAVIDATYDIVPCVKVQIAFYEALGVHGIETFAKTLLYAKSKGLIVITDAKRNDIGSTSAAYGKAFLSENAPFACDFLTINGYLGTDGIKSFTEYCKEDKGIFVLVKTSNPSSCEIQNMELKDGRHVYELMSDLTLVWGSGCIGEYGYSNVGAVVGATHKAEAEILRQRHKNIFFLIPGYDAQGGSAADLAVSFDERGLGGIINNSRGILCAYRNKYNGKSFDEAARLAALDMKADLESYIRIRG